MWYAFLYRRKVVTSEAVAEVVRSCQSLSVIMSQVKQVSFKPRFKNCQRRTVKSCPRKWVPNSRCRVTEASCREVSFPGRLCQQWSARRAKVPHTVACLYVAVEVGCRIWTPLSSPQNSGDHSRVITKFLPNLPGGSTITLLVYYRVLQDFFHSTYSTSLLFTLVNQSVMLND